MRYFKALILILIIMFLMLFLVQNTEPLMTKLDFVLDLKFVKYQAIELPLYLIVICAIGASAFLTALFLLGDKIRSSKKLKDCRTRMAGLEQELNSLRNLPLEEENYPSTSEEKPAEETKED